MPGDPNEIQPQNPPGKRHQIDQEPIRTNDDELIVPGDPLDIDPGKEDTDLIGDSEGELGNAFEKPHKPTTPSATDYDGIRDGDRDANDQIPYDEEDDFPRGHT